MTFNNNPRHKLAKSHLRFFLEAVSFILTDTYCLYLFLLARLYSSRPSSVYSCCYSLPASTCLYLPLPASTCLNLSQPASTCLYLPLPASTCLYLPLPASTCLYLPLPASTCLYLAGLLMKISSPTCLSPSGITAFHIFCVACISGDEETHHLQSAMTPPRTNKESAKRDISPRSRKIHQEA
jgi:hypothetical protein